MLNYQELGQKFTNKLNSFDKNQLLRWIEFDQYRDVVSKLIGGEMINVKSTTLSKNELSDMREDIFAESSNSSYAMAA